MFLEIKVVELEMKSSPPFMLSINAYPFVSTSLVLVVDGIPVDREKNYEGETIVLLRNLIKSDAEYHNICFLDWINKRNNEEKCQLRDKLLQGVLDAAPTKHHKRQDIHLQMDEIISLKDQYNQIQSEFKKQREKYRTEIEKFQQRHEQEMKEKQQVFKRMKEEMLSQQRRYHELHSQLLHQQHLQQGANTVATALCLTRNPYAMLIGALIALGIPTISKELHDGKK
ncbi:unnamed protein product [Rotaria sp. Silwood1]|nr:unnamed protein product [Rotaria sp. Silwood1]